MKTHADDFLKKPPGKKIRIYLIICFVIIVSAILSPSLLHAQAIKDSILQNYTQKDYQDFLLKELRGEIPVAYGPVPSGSRSGDALVNNNAGATGFDQFTQSETSILAFGSNVVIGFNDAGSYAGGANKFTGWSYSSDGGVTFTDGGALPTNPIGDAGDPVLARNESTGRIYYATLGFSGSRTIQVFRSDDNAVTWLDPVNGTPGGSVEDKQWMAVDNFPGPGNGNVYLISRRFGAGPGIYMFRSTDHGNTYGPIGGTLIVAGSQGAYVIVGPDHSVYAFWYAGTTLKMRKSTDLGLTFGTPVTVVSDLSGGSNGDLALTGLRQGTASYSAFRSNSFPNVAVNPVSGHLYVTFNDNPAGMDKGDVFMVMSTDGGATWSARVRVNDDATTTDNWQPTIAVTNTGTHIGIFYYSRQDDGTSNNLFAYTGRTGVINGPTITFASSFVVSDVQSLPEFGRDAVVNTTYMGDYNCVAATATHFHVVWSDNRDDHAGGAPRKDPNIYYESILAGLLTGPNIDVTPATVNFTSVAFSQAKTIGINISNIGDAPLDISAISSPGLDFSLNSVSLPLILPSLGSVTLNATFTPLGLGLQNSSFIITSNAINLPSVTVGLEGQGISNISVSHTNVDFGYVLLAVTAGPVSVVVENLGSTDLTISAISSPAPDFYLDPVSLPLVIPALGSQTLNTYFSPMTAGVQYSSFNITSDAIGMSSITVNLQGNGIPNNDICEDAIAVDCGSIVNGTTVSFTPDSTACRGRELHAGLWYTIVGTGGTIRISTCPNAGHPEYMWVLTGNCEAMICVESDDRYCTTGKEMTFNSIADSIYYILVYGGWPSTNYIPGPFTLTVESCWPHLEASPSPLIFNVPFNGSATDVVTISNTADARAENLNWNILSFTDDPVMEPLNQSGNGMQASIENPEPENPGAEPEGNREQMNIGGPDGFGYVFIDSDEPDGPVFDWVDISGTGTPLVLGNDASVLVPLPFTFSFYGYSKTDVMISSNGYLTFGTNGSTAMNRSIPYYYPPNDIICPFWDDLDPTLGGTIHYLANSTTFIVQYTEIRHSGTTQPNTFQVILHQDGSIIFQYLDMQGLLPNSTTIGIENSTGQVGLLVHNWMANYMHNNLAVSIFLPPCTWISSVAPLAGTIPGSSLQDVTVSVDATGLAIGAYNCEILINSNAMNPNQLVVPVILNVVNADTIPPVITTQEITLWPPNHQYENLDLSEMIVSITDNVDGDIPVNAAIIYWINSDEADDEPGDGDGNTINDIVIAPDCKSADLRKERRGHNPDGSWSNGRVYYVVLFAEDAAGNLGMGGCRVLVPFAPSWGAWDDGYNHLVYGGCWGNPEMQPVLSVKEDGTEDEFTLISYPNPASGRITIEFFSHTENSYVIELKDLTGRKLIESQGKAIAGKNTTAMELGGIAKGIYLVKLVLDGKQVVKKLVIE